MSYVNNTDLEENRNSTDNHPADKKSGISSTMLKILACVFMLIDHIGWGICEKALRVMTDAEQFSRLYQVDRVLRTVGRLAFPIFCYQLVVGFFYTKNRKKYALSLLLFSLASEIPFDLLARGSNCDFSYQNVGFTLLLGFLAIWVSETLENLFFKPGGSENTDDKGINNDIAKWLLKIIAIIPFMVIADIMKTDYSSKGVLLIVLIYFLFEDQIKMACIAPSLFLLYYFLISLIRLKNGNLAAQATMGEMPMIAAFVFILKDNRERSNNKLFKLFGYLFYPVHMLIIYFVSKLVI